jgi:hypothetical protein
MMWVMAAIVYGLALIAKPLAAFPVHGNQTVFPSGPS